MAEPERLLREYIKRFEKEGFADPRDFLDRVEGAERKQLSALIDGYLEQAAPRQVWDPDAFEGSVSERAVARVAESWSDASGKLPQELVRLRNERKITRADLVSKLAKALGVAGKREKVAFYYHRLERGLLPAERISSRVWDSLAELLNTSADTLRRAGSAVTPASGQGPIVSTYARTTPASREEYIAADGMDASPGAPSPGRPKAEEPDEVDRLFTGGD